MFFICNFIHSNLLIKRSDNRKRSSSFAYKKPSKLKLEKEQTIISQTEKLSSFVDNPHDHQSPIGQVKQNSNVNCFQMSQVIKSN